MGQRRTKMIVSEIKARSIPAPPSTETWNPFPHAQLLDTMQEVAEIADISPTSTRYELSKNGNRFFGVWNFDQEDTMLPSPSIGFRSSIDKSLSVGLTGGTHVVVCSNLMFSGEWIQFRKHTKFVMADLFKFVADAFIRAMHRSQDEVTWQRRLDDIELMDFRWKTLTYDALDMGVIAVTKTEKLFAAGRGDNLTMGLWFNIITHELSSRSLLGTEENYVNLKKIVQKYLGE
jgi:hypothetical protein